MNGLEVLPSWYWCCHSTLAAEDILEAKLQQYVHGFFLSSHSLKLELTIQLDDYITCSNRGNEAISHAGGDEAGPRQEQVWDWLGSENLNEDMENFVLNLSPILAENHTSFGKFKT